MYPEIIMLITAQLLYLVTCSSDIKVLIKTVDQRTELETQRVNRGLFRSTLFEMLIFIPASVALICIIFPVVYPIGENDPNLDAKYGLLGVMSYGFPYLSVKAIITRVALNTLREFDNISLKDDSNENKNR